jgi:ABC-type multidrug transport system fused ATPase/permease subunit
MTPASSHPDYPPRLLEFLMRNRKVFYRGILFALLRTMAVAPLPIIFQMIMDEFVVTANYRAILAISIFSVGLLFLHYSFSVLGAVHIGRQNGYMLMRMRSDIFNKLHFLNFGFLDRQKSGRLLSKYAFDTQKVEHITMQIMNNFLPNTLYSVTISIILVYLHWQLSLLFVLLIPLYAITRYVFDRQLRRINENTRLAQEKLTGAANEAISALRLVRSFGEEDQVTTQLDERSLQVARNRFHLVNINSIYGTFAYMMMQLFTLLTVAGGALMVIGGSMTFGTLLAFMAGLPIVLMPIQLFTAMVEQFFIAQEGYRSIKELLDSHYVEAWNGSKQPSEMQGKIQFDHITFAYPNTTRNILTDFNLTIKPGEHVALVGPSGSGKSTIAQLVLGLYKPDAGVISVDDIPQPELDMRWLRKNAAVVLQDIVLFSGSIYDNIRFARSSATDGEVEQAARMANAEDFIKRLPEGYETVVGERGVMLSGGQRQRISIARAILRNPRILILDEATSALDYESERLVQDALRRVSEGRTVITIAHRLSTIRDADRIVVMKDGRIMETGSFDALAEQDGLFAELLRMQSHAPHEL